MHPWLRSVLAILGGFVVMVAIVLVTTAIAVPAMHVAMGHPTRSYLAVNLACSFAAATAGGFLAARIAGRSPFGHGIALALLLVAMSGVSAAQSWGQQPHGYLVALAAGSPLFCILGAWWQAARRRQGARG